MKEYGCPKCGSVDVFLEKNENQTGLYCGDCGVWIKWLPKSEVRLVERFVKTMKGETK